MAYGDTISCKQYAHFLASDLPQYDKEILKDYRPTDGGLMGYYVTGSFDAYTGVTHYVDRLKAVFPDVTKPWTDVTTGDCVGTPCDPTENKICWGWDRESYTLEQQSWGTHVLCFDEIMTKTRAKEHFRQIIDDVLRPSTSWVMTALLQRKAAELAGVKKAVTTALPDIEFTWDAGGYQYMNVDDGAGNPVDATGLLTPEILQTRVRRLYGLGAIQARQSFDKLQLHTDMDTFWRFTHDYGSNAMAAGTMMEFWKSGTFNTQQEEFWKYGLAGFIGDFVVKCLMFPMRFNRIGAGRYQQVLPYVNSGTTLEEGIGSDWNTDYDNAQYQWSFINNPRALRVLPFRPGAVNPEMPFLVRDYAGKWSFATNDLGADCAGKPIDNTRRNKGKFFNDFRLAIKPEHPEWLEAWFHKVDRPCVTIIETCNDDPGYPSQSYSSECDACGCVIVFEPLAAEDGSYYINNSGISCNGNNLNTLAMTAANIEDLVTALNNDAVAAALGTWIQSDASGNEDDAGEYIALTSTDPCDCDDPVIIFLADSRDYVAEVE